ncbi:Haloacid dehalogenase-like hydrolase [Roseibacterium elongatum DSM 19469]|uniref:Haloacid dehalogenase-like hydrolase n=1 Tax=Roseicyclus elongatus DSM 19469 TaxID=1294273 RepID=W8RNJ8_9RHOB|nr:HAD-IA family hydrolase [Roseibacterium elongatum]AHM02729.1 Haloacid dehalogenase-like hydrolase [Roseibacterium elongatum DSM 19469]
MGIKGIFFGAIGTLAETSEVQREAFNLAFRQSGLDWVWDQDSYFRMLEEPGGARRIADYARQTGDVVDAPAIYSRKVANFRALVLDRGIAPRAGVVAVIEAARQQGVRVGWATSTYPETVDLMLAGLAGAIPRAAFDYIGDGTRVKARKPAPDIYRDALAQTGVAAAEALAIEDTPESAEAALAAGLRCVAFPGEAARERTFPAGCPLRDTLSADLLKTPLAA